ncbi:hypothetical protein PC118_g16789 [Phytophthora cactorum]|uniref:Uncharacterized protein n=1 Tax=Phytophthora cactorum TaxID=29920 RepID=A0A8T1FDY9_9STRA|nr:hypothetical protein PC118_g16789 [Phytophthora cactorum]
MSESQLLAEPADVQMEDCEPSRDYEGGAEDAESSSSTYPSETEPRGRTSERFITWDQSTSKKEEQAESPTDQEDSRVRHNQKRMNQSCGTFENDDVQQGWSRSGERRKSVDALVHKSFWVRAAHLKAMAMHAREQVFVLDVSPNGAARIQMYAYRDLSISPTERI